MAKQDITFDSLGRPSAFQMQIHSGMLETIGHNMYSSIAKCLAEFVANAYDADADTVAINMDFEAIDRAKKDVRAKAKQEKLEGNRKDITAIYDPLPSTITITITDDGHGMSPNEIQDCFMAITRNRREDDDGRSTKIHTESGKRLVMGRKGVGKLAGFGAAEHIKIKSKRATQNYSTTFEMDYSNFKEEKDLTEPAFKASYTEEVNDKSYTIVTLSQLRCDSMKSSASTIKSILARNFSILDQGFEITINNDRVEEERIEWEYTYPPGHSLKRMASETVIVDEDDEDSMFDVQYLIRFRARPGDTDGADKQKRASLPAGRRGARIYSHGRLTHGPSLLGLHSGVHNFHAQDYMECVVLADAIDEFDHDCIVTSREGLHSDNPAVSKLFESLTELMRKALAEHYKFREKKTDEAIKDDDFSQNILSPLQLVNKKSRRAAQNILKAIGKEHGIKSDTYREMAPILLNAVNAGDVLSRLIELETNPKSLPVLAHSMAELSRIENNDLLKLYRGRSKAIAALQKLHEDSLDARKGEGYENELHQLLKEFPWLIKPEIANFLTSDKHMGDVCRALNNTLGIDHDLSQPDLDKAKLDEDHTRPDLVFIAVDSANPNSVVIVELKSPGIELSYSHLTQLKEYMFKIEDFLSYKFSKKVNVQGYLIGTKPPSDTKSTPKRHLLNEIDRQGPNDTFRVIDILELISHAKQIHNSGIEIFEAEEKRLEDDLS